MGGQSEFLAQISEWGLEYKEFKEITYYELMREKLRNGLFSSGGEFEITDEEYREKFYNDYFRIKEILFLTVAPDTMQTLSQEQMQQAAESADDTLFRINAGEDFENFLPSSQSLSKGEDGYIFSMGQMTRKIEDAAVNLKVGDVSGIIQTEYGYHIIKRCDIGNRRSF